MPLQGRVSPALIRVAKRQPSYSQNSLMVWLSGRIEQAPDGGTLVAGTIGPDPASPAVCAVLSLLWLMVAGGMLAAGLWSLVSGHPILPLLLVPMVFAAAYVFILVAVRLSARSETRELLDELNTILDSTAAFADD